MSRLNLWLISQSEYRNQITNEKFMRKKILLIAFVIAGTFSVSTVAQGKNSNNCPQKECTATNDCRHSNCPLEGLNLTDAQKAQIKTLNGQMCDSRKELRDQKAGKC